MMISQNVIPEAIIVGNPAISLKVLELMGARQEHSGTTNSSNHWSLLFLGFPAPLRLRAINGFSGGVEGL
jgi:hypothetical protein